MFMKGLFSTYILLLTGILLFAGNPGYSQNAPQGFSYQTVVRNASGLPVISQAVGIRFSLYAGSPAGTLVWQEDHALTTDSYGLARTIIGTGTSTGAGTLGSFSLVNWGSASYFLKVSADATGGSSYIDMGSSQLFSVPYVFYAAKTAGLPGASLAQMNDANLTGLATGKVLKWNGSYWMPGVDNDSDTVLFAMNALHANDADTALYTFGSLTTDTVLFAYATDSALYSGSSQNASSTNTSVHSDTATYALASPPTAWKINGNAITGTSSYIGTNDNSNIAFISDNALRAALKSNGNLTIGNSPAGASMGLLGNEGLFAIGVLNSVYTPVQGAGTRLLWSPSKGAFRAGSVDASQWDSASVGKYSIAAGYNSKSNVCSFSSGRDNEAVDYSVAFGRQSKAMGVGPYPGGNSIAMGDSCISSYQRAISIGKNNVASNGADVAAGYGNIASGGTSVCLGSFCKSPGARSLAMGYHASSNFVGSFVFADASSATTVNSAVNHQFVARASGGMIFYTDTMNTMGVTLNPGSGSWATISDRNKKENFEEVDYEFILGKIDELRISSWKYKAQSKRIRHIGPMAQDFYRAFNVGENNISISTTDMDGVILSGIRGLNTRINVLDKKFDLDALKFKVTAIDNAAELNSRLDAIEAALNKN
ncbi:MAG: hypothetical protein JWO44_1558 [Bacteroidetes bacterium]|nr:hypothetical protein [Bacteroidota bacterium]